MNSSGNYWIPASQRGDQIKKGRLRWFGHVQRDGDWYKLCMMMKTEET